MSRRIFLLKRFESRPDHVVGVRGTLALGDDVMDAERLEDGAHRAAGDDAGAGRGRTQHDAAGAMAAENVMMNGPPIAQRHADQSALGGFRRLADGLRNFPRLAVTEADAALLVANDDQRCETEAPATLDHLGDAIDVDELVDKLAVAIVTIPTAPLALLWFSCHLVFRSSDIVV